MVPAFSPSVLQRPRGFRVGIVIGVAIALFGLVVGTATGATPFQQVIVVNAPASPIPVSLQGTGTISGTVSVSNLPATQPVSGTVDVGNLPATQPVSGTVDVGNLPATQPVSGTVNVGNLPATQPVSGTVNVGNFPATTAPLATKAYTSPAEHLGQGTAAQEYGLPGFLFNVSTLILDNGGFSDTMSFKLVTAAGPVIDLHFGDGTFIENFSMPVPASAVIVQCYNGLAACDFHISAVGP